MFEGSDGIRDDDDPSRGVARRAVAARRRATRRDAMASRERSEALRRAMARHRAARGDAGRGEREETRDAGRAATEDANARARRRAEARGVDARRREGDEGWRAMARARAESRRARETAKGAGGRSEAGARDDDARGRRRGETANGTEGRADATDAREKARANETTREEAATRARRETSVATVATGRRASAAARCFCFASAGDEETRTLEDLDDEAAHEGAETFASTSRAVEAVVEPVVTATRVAEGEDADSSERERVALDRARMEREVRELEIRLRSEEDALRARERSLVERENRIAERERLAADKETEAERRLAELQIEEKRLLNVSQSQRRQDSSTNATAAPEGDLSDVGEAGLKTELGRMRKTTKQFTEKERAMIEQINALRRARDASEARVRSLADELKDTKKDYEMWSKEEKATERKYSSVAAQSPAESSPSPARTTLDDRDLPEWLRSPEPARRDTNLGSPVGPDSVSPTYKKFSPAKLIIPEEASSKTSIEKDAPKTLRENGVQHPIFSAVRNGRVSEAQEILVHNSTEFDVDTRDSFGNTVLIVAAQNNRKRVTKMCVRAGVPLDARNKQGNTALHYCYGYGYFELGEYLVSKGADERVTNAAGETAYDGLSAENRRALESTRRAIVASRDAKRRSRPTAPDRDEASYLASYSDAESAVSFTDDDE